MLRLGSLSNPIGYLRFRNRSLGQLQEGKVFLILTSFKVDAIQ